MRKKVTLVVLALSLALNAGFALTWAVRTFSARGEQAAPAEEGGVWSPLHRRLDVTPEQWRKIEPHMREFLQKMEKRQKKIMEARRGMLNLLFSPDVTPEKIEKQQERVLQAFRGTQDLVLNHVLTEREYLTDEQERKLKRMLLKRMENSGPGNPPIGRQAEPGGQGVGRSLRQMEDGRPHGQ